MLPIQKISMDLCKDRYIYKLKSNHLCLGVYNSSARSFIGIKCKDGYYLFSEDHVDVGTPFGTAIPYEELEKIPDSLELWDRGPPHDLISQRPIGFDATQTFELDKDGFRKMKGWYFIDTGEFCKDIRASSKMNEELFVYLKNFEDNLGSCALKNPCTNQTE
jgi:hypothetical protein